MDKIATIKTETEELLSKMINKFEVEVADDGGIFQVIIKTNEEVSTVIGRHGETIRAIQKILEVILYKKFNERVEILVNVNDFREKQKEKLETMAREYAEQTKSTGTAGYIRSLSSYERKLIHEYITTNYPELTTSSVGEGRERQLVIEVKK
ncbi:MAG: R3H domain-containing nucleic acid-binding protein [Candidatus Roizmanbacteria bacterium]|nr:R3H domain-containing nucleic acid-binding protein [Candidatus Roizmanbacteria bacterium]